MRRYFAFISYRHKEPEQMVSTALLKGLESFHLPQGSGLPFRRRVFRDVDELPTGTNLGAEIEGALEESDWLIPLCSKDYLSSRWCLQEAEYFIKLGRKDRILPVLLSDTPETALPEVIRDVPVAADLRGEDLSFDRKKIPEMVPAVLARMTEAASGEEEGGSGQAEPLTADDFAAAERRFRWKVTGGIAACAIAGILGFAAYAMHTADLIGEGNIKIAQAAEQTEKARAAAEERRKSAVRKNAQYIAEQSLAEYRAGHEKEAIRLALTALPEDLAGDEPVSTEALGALRIAVSQPRLNYLKKYSTGTEFDITGFTYFDSDRLLLEGGRYSEAGTFLNYSSGELEQAESEARAEAFSEGYSRAYVFHEYGKPRYKIYCGAEKQARIVPWEGETGRDLTLHGEPFYADRILYDFWKDHFLAWLEAPQEGQEQRTAVFSVDHQAEAVTELPVSGRPVLAEFYEGQGYPEILIIDSEGTLGVYDAEDGSEIRVFEGKWNAACFVSQNHQPAVLAADDSGWSLLQMSSGEAVMKAETPSPVRGLAYCPNRSALLVRCDDGVRICSLETGNILWSRIPEESLRFALWSGMVPGRQSYVDGNAIVLLFDRRAEIWALNAEEDTDGTAAVPLCHEGVYNRSEQVFFTDDGSRVFVQMRDGTLAGFDGRDGTFLWAAEGSLNPSASHFPSIVSPDQSAIWRAGENGRERIDIETGEILYTIKDSAGRDPIELPEKGLGILPGSSWDGIKCFDLATGEVLWNSGRFENAVLTEYPGYPMFSEDLETVRYISMEYGTEEHVQEVHWSRIESRTGKILEEKTLIRAPQLDLRELDGRWRLAVREEEGLAVFFVYPGEAPAGLPLYLIDLEKGEVSAEIRTPGPNTQVVFSAAGGVALRWMEKPCEIVYGLDNDGFYESEYIFCCRLNADGTLGETIPASSEEGRRLLARETQLLTFAGEEAMLNTVQIDRKERYNSHKPHQIRRISDNALLLDAGEDIIAASPAGGMVCVYQDSIANIVTPYLLPDADAKTLVRKAKKRLEELE